MHLPSNVALLARRVLLALLDQLALLTLPASLALLACSAFFLRRARATEKTSVSVCPITTTTTRIDDPL